MPVYKDNRGKWYCKFYYTDYTGTRKQKKKSGFTLQREAKDWEADFLARQARQPTMPFDELCRLYLEDKATHAKPSSLEAIRNRVTNYVIPAFEGIPANEISPADIRQWQGKLKDLKGKQGRPLSPGYMQVIITELSSVFNYGVQFYGLATNPCKAAGNLVGKKSRSMNFWTKDQFDQFIATFDKADPYYTMFMILYYTGMRKGELQALTPADIDLENGQIHISKTFRIIQGKQHIMPPKTAKSRRCVFIPPFLCDVIRDYMARLYAPDPDDMIFCYGRSTFSAHLDKHAALAGVPRIRIHDLRHSHASLLIEMGFSALLVAERLGHENVSTTLDIYSHLFPSKQSQVADRLQLLHQSGKWY